MFSRLIPALALVLTLPLAPVLAQEAAPTLSLELNALQPADGACRVTFLVTNGLAAPIETATVEVAFFGAAGGIDRLVSLDFKALATGKTKVVQFALAGLDCGAVSRVLVNDVTACTGAGLDAAACLAALATSSRVSAAFGV
jgi:hypothetical protein